MKAFMVYPTYRIVDGKAQVMLYGRLETGESFVTIHDFKPYFWIKASDKEKAEQILKDIDTKNITIEDSDFKNFQKEPVCKVTLSIPKEVPELRKHFLDKNIVSFEADIRFPYRFLIDHNIKASLEIKGESVKDEEFKVDKVFLNPNISPVEYWPDLKMLSIDIETDAKAKKVIAISFYGKDINKVLLVKEEGTYENAETFPTEEELLEAFKKEVIDYDPDILVGWNFIDFDLKVLRDRCRNYDISFTLGRSKRESTLRLSESFFTDSSAQVDGRAVLDGIHLMKVSFIKLDDYKLNTAAKTILGDEKLLTQDHRFEEIERLYHEDTQKLVDYNLKDAKLVYDIFEKSEILDLTIRRSMLTRMQLERVHASIASLDSVYLRELKERKIVAPTAYVRERTERIKGGFVMDSKPGIYKTVLVLDFKSLYPSIIRTFNIDPLRFIPFEEYEKLSNEEKDPLIEAPNGAHFERDEGILPLLIQQLWESRDAAKKRNDHLGSQAIKILMNSFFGVLANPTCRFYSLELANAITHFGQYLNKLTSDKIREKGYEVIYGDTDSIFVNVHTDNVEEAKKVGREIQEHVNKFYADYIKEAFMRPSFLELEFEKTFSRFIMPKVRGTDKGAKKRYAGLIEKNGKEEITIVGLEFVRRDWTAVAKEFQMSLLDHVFHDKPYEKYIKDFVADLKAGKMDKLLIYKKAIRKGVSEYTKTTPPHIKAARKLGRELPGIIEYVMTINGPEPLEQNPSKLDYDHYIEKQVKPVADAILSFQDKSFDDLLAKHKQMDLSSFS